MTADPLLRRRGQPIVALALLLAGWVGLRVAVWEETVPAAMHSDAQFPLPVAAAPPAAPVAGQQKPQRDDTPFPAPERHRFLESPRHQQALPLARPVPSPGAAAEPDLRLIAGHQLLWMAGLGYLNLPEAVRPALAALTGAAAPSGSSRPGDPVPASRTAARSSLRWSADGWLLVRGGGTASLASGSPAYGGSQAGAVVRYRLGSGSREATYLYARATGALDLPGDRPELALGAGLRPVAALPVRLLTEARMRREGSGVRVRPAILAVSELPPARLPGRIVGEVYAQAGYVGGRDATGFFDLQALADRSVARPARGANLRVGGGVWAGGQRGAARLDLGPRIALGLDLGRIASRVALDWRLRVAGNAAPASGAALTVSAGF